MLMKGTLTSLAVGRWKQGAPRKYLPNPMLNEVDRQTVNDAELLGNHEGIRKMGCDGNLMIFQLSFDEKTISGANGQKKCSAIHQLALEWSIGGLFEGGMRPLIVAYFSRHSEWKSINLESVGDGSAFVH